MSHFTRIKTQLKDLHIVKQALEDLGYEVFAGSVRGFQSQQAAADLVIRPGGTYDIGFREENDKIVMIADIWGLTINRDKFLEQVTQRYAYLVVLKEAHALGFEAVEEETQRDGSIRLVMQRWA
nr:DUF1257 domain-containing protein [Anaerolineae bacterium]